MIKEYNNNLNLDNCLLFFCNTNCYPCKLLEEELFNLNIDIYKVNIEKYLDVAKSYDITSIPSLLFFKNKEKVFITTGVRSLRDINKILEHFNMI